MRLISFAAILVLAGIELANASCAETVLPMSSGSSMAGIGVDYELTIKELSSPPYSSGDAWHIEMTIRAVSGNVSVESIGIETGRGFPFTLFTSATSNCEVFFNILPFGLDYWRVNAPTPDIGQTTVCDIQFEVHQPQILLTRWFLLRATDPVQSNNQADLLFDPNGRPPPMVIPTLGPVGVVALGVFLTVLGIGHLRWFRKHPRA